MADSGIGILMVEQNAEAGLDVADDVVAVARGEVVYSGPAAGAQQRVGAAGLPRRGRARRPSDRTGGPARPQPAQPKMRWSQGIVCSRSCGYFRST